MWRCLGVGNKIVEFSVAKLVVVSLSPRHHEGTDGQRFYSPLPIIKVL